ncbi:MAG: efflux transporter outer membrane subunit [Simkaniaceae bacterium]|nr:MAG: efflux transporter outer membrane subunit [Simkaniaceae bacterium]
MAVFRLIIPAWILLPFLFESCAALKKRNHEPDAMETAEIAPAIDSALETPNFSKGEWPSYNWWTLFEDDQLSEMMELALEGNPDLMAAVARVRSSDQAAKKARAPLLPKLNTAFDDNYQHLSKDELVRYPPSTVPAVIKEIHLSLNFEYEIDLFGKNRNQYRAAIGLARAQAAEMSQSLLIITTSLAEAYINYGANFMDLQISRDLVAARKFYLELTELRRNYGIDDELAIDRARTLLLEGEKVVLEYEKKMTIAESQLKILMGMSPDDPREFSPPTLSFDRPFPLPENIPLNLLARRPDLMAQIWKVEAAAHMIKAAKAAFFPNINLKAFAGLQSLHWNNLFSIESFAGAINPAINLPLFTGGKLTAQLNEEYANYDADVYDYNTLVLKAAKEVSDQIKVLNATTEQAKLESEAFMQILHSSELTLARYENGIDDYLTVLNQQIAVMNEAMNEVEIQNKRYLSILMLIKALGGGYGQYSGTTEK